MKEPRLGRLESITLGDAVVRTGGVLQTGPFGSQLHASDYTSAGTPLIMPVNLGDNEVRETGIARVGERDARRLRRHALREGDIVFSRRGDVGRRSIVRVEQEGWLCGTGCLAARFGKRRDEINPRYIAEYLGSKRARSWLVDNAVGGTMPNLNTGILAALPIELPSLAEQDAVVDVLESCRKQVIALERMIAKKQAIKQGIMQQLLTGRTRLPGFTAPWREATLGDVATINPEALPAGSDPKTLLDYISLEDVERGELLRHTQVRFGLAPSRARRVIREMDVLFGTVRPNLQSHTLFQGGLRRPIASTGFAIVRASTTGLDPHFLFYLLMSHLARVQIERIIAGSNYPAVSSTDVRNLIFDLPVLAEQQAIGRVLADCDDGLSVLKARLVKARHVKQGMMQELLTGPTRLLVEEGAA